jgi:broad specificity phosphatase PhoE
MTATILLIRHAAHGHLGHTLSGRLPGIGLSAEGRAQAARLAQRLAQVPMAALHASPVQRAEETAQAIAASHPGLAVEAQAALDEIDFGEWTGRSFAALASDPGWHAWNRERAVAMPPGGESMAAAQHRAWDHLLATAAAHPGESVAMVTHCDIIRALIVRILDLPLDAIHRFDIDPASLTRVAAGDWGAKVLSLNEGAR